MSRKLAGEPAGELAGVGSDDDGRLGLASLASIGSWADNAAAGIAMATQISR